MRRLAYLGLGTMLMCWPLACGDDDGPSPSSGGSNSGGAGGSTNGGSTNGGATSGGSGGTTSGGTGGTMMDPDAGMDGGMDMDSGMTLTGRAADCAAICATEQTVADTAGGACAPPADCENFWCGQDSGAPSCATTYEAYLACLGAEPTSSYSCEVDDVVRPTGGTCSAEFYAFLYCLYPV